jgi:hypothetical protein
MLRSSASDCRSCVCVGHGSGGVLADTDAVARAAARSVLVEAAGSEPQRDALGSGAVRAGRLSSAGAGQRMAPASAPIAMLLAILPAGFAAQEHDGRQLSSTLAAMRIDLVGTTADFRRFGHPQPLPINHLLCENRRTQGRMGEVGLGRTEILVRDTQLRPDGRC